jgi:hypothetical protein
MKVFATKIDKRFVWEERNLIRGACKVLAQQKKKNKAPFAHKRKPSTIMGSAYSELCTTFIGCWALSLERRPIWKYRLPLRFRSRVTPRPMEVTRFGLWDKLLCGSSLYLYLGWAGPERPK